MSAALIFIFNYNLELSTRQAVQSDLIDLCDSCTEFYLSDPDNFSDLRSEKRDLFDNGLICGFSKKKWGSYTVLTVQAFFKKDTIQKSAFVGPREGKDKLALVVCDWDEPLKISGLTKVIGPMKLPSSGYKMVNILGNNQLNKPQLSGAITKSSQSLPEITTVAPLMENTSGIRTNLSKIDKRSLLYNDFKETPIVIELDMGEQLNNLSFKGNVLIKSIDTLYIDSSTGLKDVIVQAPKIVIRKGFEGRAQFFAEKEIFVEEAVLLAYPSSLVVTSGNSLLDKKITLSKHSKLYGGVVMDATTFDEKEANKIIVEEDASITGTLFCNGRLQLQGTVRGTVHAHKLQLETKSGKYENTLLNSTIDAVNIPNGFIYPPLFKTQEKTPYGIAKTL
ncbi:polymer-forming cytoskeletal protein [Flavobacteriaceae bacterium TP-CH-4]|uniref:Polymer-forming cytoskeletal protein n=1 Tax=Pelagihabitans pacificus TaxID=2696054 RepID=A0A967AS66_9FLAO|nr:polymer-forming cytoskeletal protein [Pelagihabitans pacificus]NHF59002.1 polymer-forming cytoskeletal protein [Pelagihabitans pacificus]